MISLLCNAQSNIIPVSVPFLNLVPDARSAGMGEIGVATPADAYSAYWNPGKTTFTDSEGAISASYSPYLRALNKGMDFLNLSGYIKPQYNKAIGYYARYLSMVETIYRNDQGIEKGLKRPFDLTIGGTYSIRISEGLGIGAGVKYIHSSVTTIGESEQLEISSANALSFDLGIYYEKYIQDTKLAYGLSLNNIGTKIKYANTIPGFQPMNLKIGGSANFLAGVNGSLTIGADITKPLTPTPPQIDENGNITKGSSMEKSVVKAIFSSFTDAPGGITETIQGLTYGIGAEYDYMQQFFFRCGLVYEHKNKGEKRYGTLGAGFKYHNFQLDGAYYLPFDSFSPFKNSMKLTLSFNIE